MRRAEVAFVDSGLGRCRGFRSFLVSLVAALLGSTPEATSFRAPCGGHRSRHPCGRPLWQGIARHGLAAGTAL